MVKHKFNLSTSRLKRTCPGGNRQMITKKQHAAFHNMAIATITLKKGGRREPHWHPNADEITYCLEGKALITIFSPGNIQDTFTLSQGEVVYFPKGYIHHIENIHDGVSRFLLTYDHNQPEDLDLSETLTSMSAHVLSATFESKEGVFKQLKKRDLTNLTKKNDCQTLSSVHYKPKQIQFGARINPQIQTAGGLARIANHKNFPKLEHFALF